MKRCACCGAAIFKQLKQWWDRDTGYSICEDCVAWLKSRGETDEEIKQSYGIKGINY